MSEQTLRNRNLSVPFRFLGMKLVIVEWHLFRPIYVFPGKREGETDIDWRPSLCSLVTLYPPSPDFLLCYCEHGH